MLHAYIKDMEKPKIVVVGSSNTDMVVRVPHIPAPGETVMGSSFMTIQGGKGANQAVAAIRAGARVTFITCVSDDAFGEQSVDAYRSEGIDVSCIKVQKGTHSGIAIINVAGDGENSISVAPGANSNLYPEDINASRDVFSDAGIVLAQLEVPMETVVAAAEMAYSKGIPFILNPAPGAAIPASLFEMITVLTPNETEAALLAGRKTMTGADVQGMAADLYSKGVRNVVVTMGSNGVFLKNSDYEGFIPGYRVKAVDTTAAGDVFNGAFASAIATGKSVNDSIDFAQRAAAISVTRIGAQPSAPFYNEITDYVF